MNTLNKFRRWYLDIWNDKSYGAIPPPLVAIVTALLLGVLTILVITILANPESWIIFGPAILVVVVFFYWVFNEEEEN